MGERYKGFPPIFYTFIYNIPLFKNAKSSKPKGAEEIPISI